MMKNLFPRITYLCIQKSVFSPFYEVTINFDKLELSSLAIKVSFVQKSATFTHSHHLTKDTSTFEILLKAVCVFGSSKIFFLPYRPTFEDVMETMEIPRGAQFSLSSFILEKLLLLSCLITIFLSS